MRHDTPNYTYALSLLALGKSFNEIPLDVIFKLSDDGYDVAEIERNSL